MGRIDAARTLVVPAVAAVLITALAGAGVLSLVAPDVAEAQTEPSTAANGILLPPVDFDPAAARNEDLAEIAVVSATSTAPVPPADESTVTEDANAVAATPDAVGDAPDAITDAPETGNSVTTILGGSDVAVSSVGGSYEVDRPTKRSARKQ